MRIMLSCGEPSGDLYAGALVRELRARQPDVEVFGLGGEQVRAAGARLIDDFSGISVTGLAEAIRVIPRSYGILRRLVAEARKSRPDVFVAIDFPDFNLRLIAALHRLGIPVVYYISPQLWAWRAGRMAAMKRNVNRVLVIFPFEEAIYRAAGVPVSFVGHPLVDIAVATHSRDEFLRLHGLNPDHPTVALLPGSRPNELRRIGPVMAAALPLIRNRVPEVQFLVARAPNLDDALFRVFGDTPLVVGKTDDVLNGADAVITASGTATVQTALHARPMVVVYRLSPVTYAIGKPFVRVDTYAMVNLVAGRRVVTELIQDDFTPERTADETVALLTDRAGRQAMVAALTDVRAKLGSPGASGRAAEEVLRAARGGPTA